MAASLQAAWAWIGDQAERRPTAGRCGLRWPRRRLRGLFRAAARAWRRVAWARCCWWGAARGAAVGAAGDQHGAGAERVRGGRLRVGQAPHRGGEAPSRPGRGAASGGRGLGGGHRPAGAGRAALLLAPIRVGDWPAEATPIRSRVTLRPGRRCRGRVRRCDCWPSSTRPRAGQPGLRLRRDAYFERRGGRPGLRPRSRPPWRGVRRGGCGDHADQCRALGADPPDRGSWGRRPAAWRRP